MTTSLQNTVYAVPRGWVRYTANEIKADNRYACVAGPFGSNISSKYFVEDGVPVIRGSNLRDDLTRFISDNLVFVSQQQSLKYKPQHVRAGDLVFTCWGTIGQVGIIPENGSYEQYIISNKQLKLSLDRNIANPLFCFYYFASPKYTEYIRSRNIGGAVPGINLGILKSLPIALPRLEEQTRVVEVLSAYDDLIANNTRRIELLERSAQLLFEEWFVRLRYPGHEHDKIVDGLPAGWERKTIGEVYPLSYGKALPGAKRAPGDFPVYGSSGEVGAHNASRSRH
jgi:type I restriction enzyme, S subunit